MTCSIEKKCKFLTSVINKKELPKENIKEIAFWGRSNVGKSSLINSLTKSNIAKTSKTPGRTQFLNFFEIPKKIRFVDFPGYGFSKVSKSIKKNWNNLITQYMSSRKMLHSIFLLIDSRHGLKKIDLEAINFIESYGNHFFIVLTKIDKISEIQIEKCRKSICDILVNKVSADKNIFTTSVTKKIGIIKLKKEINKII